ncbi:hypothetical protein P9112_011166 [Eukaryota sp. TZLM1-RC]
MSTHSRTVTPVATPTFSGVNIIDDATSSPRSQMHKTEFCNTYVELGSCKFGNKCVFAHSERELRGRKLHKRFKTTKCRNFHSKAAGYICFYGTRCCYKHREGLTCSKGFSSEVVVINSISKNTIVILPALQGEESIQAPPQRPRSQRLPVFRAMVE